jgi:hypothetical protein
MTYEEFLSKPQSFKKDMSIVMEIKIKYHLEFTEYEKEINQYILQSDEDSKLSSLRGHFEKCWEIKDETN